MGDTELARLRAAADRLAQYEAGRAEVARDRDEAVVAALTAGHTWVEVQSVAGLSPRGVKLAVDRVRGDT